MKGLDEMKETNLEWGTLILRLVLGITFIVHGWDKVQGMGMENVAGWFGSIGLPSFLAYIVMMIELIGGIALLLGLGTRVVSALLGLIMVGAIIKVKLAAGFLGNGQGAGYELDLVILAVAIFLTLNGSRKLSLDHALFANAN